MTKVALNNVSKSFADTVALKDLSLTIDDGEFVVLLGPTGAGKTTTLRLVAGLDLPDAGTVTIGGHDVTKLAPAARDVAFVFQQYSLYSHYSVFDNIAFPLRAPGRNMTAGQIKKRVHDIAEMLRIESKLDNRATELSGGEMQRVSIGRALVRDPNIFLMDEPLSSLDAKLREDLRAELKRIQHDLNATILYVTHDQMEAMTLAGRVGILSQGRLVQTGTPREIYETPANIDAARRLGSPQINLLAPGLAGCASGPARAVTAGVRPEDIIIGARTGTEATVTGIEHLGAESVVQLQCNGHRLHALLGQDRALQPGHNVRFTIAKGAAIYFDDNGNLIDTHRPQRPRRAS